MPAAERVAAVAAHLRGAEPTTAPAAGGEPRFVPLKEAAAMKEGARVSMLPGVPGIFAEALKNVLYVKQVPVTRVLHPPPFPAKGQDELYALTAQRSLPVFWWADERPRSAWIEQLTLAERVGSGPRLIPDDTAQRVRMFGLLQEVLGEGGLVWSKRLLGGDNPFTRKYGWTPEAAAAAPQRMVDVIQLIDAQLQRGSTYLIGDSITALDIYWATVTIMLRPPAADVMPVTRQNKGLLKGFARNPPAVEAALTPRIIAHRELILRKHCECPAVLGGTPA